MSHHVLKYLLVVFVVLLLGVPSFWLATRPSRQTSRLGMRGKKRQQAVMRSMGWEMLEPFVRWMGVRVNGVLPLHWAAYLDKRLTEAGDFLGMTADEAFGSMVAGTIAGAVAVGTYVGLRFDNISTGLSAVPFGILLGGAVPYILIERQKDARLVEIYRALPFAIDLLALTMSAGFDFPGALRQIVERAKLPEELRDEFEYMLQQLQLGRSRAAVLKEFAARTPEESVLEFTQALVQAEERGNPVTATLEIQARTARTRRTTIAENAAESMQAKMVVPTYMLMGVMLLLVIMPAFMQFERMMGAFSR